MQRDLDTADESKVYLAMDALTISVQNKRVEGMLGYGSLHSVPGKNRGTEGLPGQRGWVWVFLFFILRVLGHTGGRVI